MKAYENGQPIQGQMALEEILMKGSGDDPMPEDFVWTGVFESLRTYDQKIFKFDEHWKRFEESLKTSGLGFSVSKTLFLAELESVLRDYLSKFAPKKGDLFIRWTFWGGKRILLVGERRHAADLFEKGVKLRTSAVKRTRTNALPPEVKSTAYQNPLYGFLDFAGDDVYETLFLDSDGYATEARVGNLFAVKGGILFSPGVQGILNGVTRRFVIKSASKIRVSFLEGPLTRHDLFNAEEIFLTNTSWEILPVAELDGRRIGRKMPGSVTKKLQAIFKKELRKKQNEQN